MKSYFNRHLKDKTFETPFKLQEYVSKQLGYNNLIKTTRTYLRYCEHFETLPIEVIVKYRKFLKQRKVKQDFHVPTDQEVIENLNKIRNNPKLEIVYLVLATSGIRYCECLEFLKTFDKTKFEIHKNYAVYSISKTRNTKTINNIYLPLPIYHKLKHVTNTYDSLRQRFKEKKCSFSLKYLRKWHYNFLIYQGVPESVSDFIQGRTNKSVSANHYLARSQQAGFWYEKIVEKLEIMFV